MHLEIWLSGFTKYNSLYFFLLLSLRLWKKKMKKKFMNKKKKESSIRSIKFIVDKRNNKSISLFKCVHSFIFSNLIW